MENQIVNVQKPNSNIVEDTPEVRFYSICTKQRPNTRQKSSEIFRSFFTNPGLDHIGRNILLNLDVQSLVKYKRVNKSWKTIIDSPKFWIKWGSRLLQKFYGYNGYQFWYKVIETEKEDTKQLIIRCLGYERFCFYFLTHFQ